MLYFWVYIHKKNVCLGPKNMYMYFHSSFIPKSYKLAIIWMSTNKKVRPINKMEFYKLINNNTQAWVDLTEIMLSEKEQIQKICIKWFNFCVFQEQAKTNLWGYRSK